MDGQGKGYDIPLLNAVQSAVSIPVIASSGAGSVEHFSEVFDIHLKFYPKFKLWRLGFPRNRCSSGFGSWNLP
jgi:hypothetical protein